MLFGQTRGTLTPRPPATACRRQLPSRKLELELTTISSNDHVELNPSDVGNNDRYVVQEIIKEMAKSRPVDMQGNRGFKVLVLNEVDKLSKEAQAGLRRTMEKYSSACRLIMLCSNISKCVLPIYPAPRPCISLSMHRSV